MYVCNRFTIDFYTKFTYLSGTWCHRNGGLGWFKRWQQAREPVQRYVIPYNSLYVNVPYKECTEFLPSCKDSIPMHPPTTFSRFKYQLMRYRWHNAKIKAILMDVQKLMRNWSIYKQKKTAWHCLLSKVVTFKKPVCAIDNILFICQLFIHLGLGSILPWTTVSLVMQLVVLPYG